MKRFFSSLLAIFFPWLILLMHDNPGGAFVSMIMQATIVGWPFASVWALRVMREAAEGNEKEKASETSKNQG